MNPLQIKLATIGLEALANYGFVLAGGYALQAHGYGTRESDDIDLFTNVLDTENFTRAADDLVAAYRSSGLTVEVARRAPLFARLVVDSAAKVDLGVDHRQRPPVLTEVGPVLSEADSIGSKVGAVYSRLEPRDFIDIQSVLDSGRHYPDALLALADQREALPLDRQMFAAQLRAGARLPDTGFTRYGATPEQIARIRRTATEWAQELDRRSDGPAL